MKYSTEIRGRPGEIQRGHQGEDRHRSRAVQRPRRECHQLIRLLDFPFLPLLSPSFMIRLVGNPPSLLVLTISHSRYHNYVKTSRSDSNIGPEDQTPRRTNPRHSALLSYPPPHAGPQRGSIPGLGQGRKRCFWGGIYRWEIEGILR